MTAALGPTPVPGSKTATKHFWWSGRCYERISQSQRGLALTSIRWNKWSSCMRGPHTPSGRGFPGNDSSIWSLETSLIVIEFFSLESSQRGCPSFLYDRRCQKTHFVRQQLDAAGLLLEAHRPRPANKLVSKQAALTNLRRNTLELLNYVNLIHSHRFGRARLWSEAAAGIREGYGESYDKTSWVDRRGYRVKGGVRLLKVSWLSCAHLF